MEDTIRLTPAPVLAKVVIGAGEEIKPAIQQAVLSLGWKRAAILNAVGSVQQMTFTTPTENTLPLHTTETLCRDAAEIVGFTGEIMGREDMDEALRAVYHDDSCPLFIHIHASCATAGGHVMGGGLKSGKAFRSLAVYLLRED